MSCNCNTRAQAIPYNAVNLILGNYATAGTPLNITFATATGRIDSFQCVTDNSVDKVIMLNNPMLRQNTPYIITIQEQADAQQHDKGWTIDSIDVNCLEVIFEPVFTEVEPDNYVISLIP